MLEKLQQSILLTEENWDEFKALFEKVHKGFFTRLKEKLPGLSPADVRFIALSKLNYSNKEMATMLGVGAGAIRQHRSRLRRKLNISEDASIEEIASSI